MSFNNPVVGGENGELIRASIQSPNYVPNVSGWTINRDGTAEFSNVTIRLDLATGSITVGPDTGPQIVLTVVDDGVEFGGAIQLPTNATYETVPAAIFSSADDGDEQLLVSMRSGATNVGSALSILELYSEENTTGNDTHANLRAQRTTTEYSELQLYEDVAYLYVQNGSSFSQIKVTLADALGNFAVVASDEIYAADDNASGNYVSRVVRGKTVNANTITTLPLGVDTEVATSDVTGTYLINGLAYEVVVNLSTRSSVGTSAAGTQVVVWKLWDGAVGGTQLGQSIQKTNGSVGTIGNDDMFRFTFTYTGTTGSKTLRLSGNKTSGADTFQAIMNTASNVLVKLAGDPANIINL